MPLLAVSVTATLAPALATSTASAAPAASPATTSLSTASVSTASTATAGGALDPYVKQKPKWKRCDADAPAKFTCATIKVPLDYRAPGGKRIDLAISRLRSTAPDKRHGVLFSNPGGPGGSGLYMPLGVQEILPKAGGGHTPAHHHAQHRTGHGSDPGDPR
jgi:hypothetical protein